MIYFIVGREVSKLIINGSILDSNFEFVNAAIKIEGKYIRNLAQTFNERTNTL